MFFSRRHRYCSMSTGLVNSRSIWHSTDDEMNAHCAHLNCSLVAMAIHALADLSSYETV
jgi:hypothetical protein